MHFFQRYDIYFHQHVQLADRKTKVSYLVYIAFNEVLSSPTPNFKCEIFYCNKHEVCKILETGGYISKYHTFLLF